MSDRTLWPLGEPDFGQPPFDWRPVVVFVVVIVVAALLFGNA